MALQDRTDGKYRAVLLIPATGFAAPKMDVTNGVVTAELPLTSLTDQNGAAIGTNANPLVVSGGTGGGSPGTATVTPKTATTTSSQAIAANSGRLGLVLTNLGAQTLYFLAGAGTASATNATYPVAANSSWSVPTNYTGQYQVVAASGSVAYTTTEYTA